LGAPTSENAGQWASSQACRLLEVADGALAVLMVVITDLIEKNLD